MRTKEEIRARLKPNTTEPASLNLKASDDDFRSVLQYALDHSVGHHNILHFFRVFGNQKDIPLLPDYIQGVMTAPKWLVGIE